MSMSIDKILDEFKDINYAYNDSSKFDTLKRMLNEAVEPVHGEWEWIGDSEEPQDGVFMCSVCNGFVYDLVVEDCKYCPYCGAVMDGKEQNNG